MTEEVWSIAAWLGEHDESGAKIVDQDGRHIATTYGGLRFQSTASEWDRYHQTGLRIANVPEYERDLRAILAIVNDPAPMDRNTLREIASRHLRPEPDEKAKAVISAARANQKLLHVFRDMPDDELYALVVSTDADGALDGSTTFGQILRDVAISRGMAMQRNGLTLVKERK